MGTDHFHGFVRYCVFPSICSIIALIFAIIAAPIEPLQKFFSERGLRGFSKGAVLCAAFVGTMVMAPTNSTPTIDDTTRGTLPSMAVTQDTADPVKSAEPTQTPEPAPTSEPTETPTLEPTPTPESTETPTPEAEPMPTPAPSPIRGRSPDTIVYVSNKSNTIHSVHDCSGMRNYREMTIYDASSRGYNFCTNCW